VRVNRTQEVSRDIVAVELDARNAQDGGGVNGDGG
jgi:hypothetical protein